MKKIVKVFLKPFKSRIGNPLGSSIFSFWLIFNWKSISVFLFSNQSIEERLKWIESNQWLCYLNFLIPLILGICYTLFIQMAFLKIDEFKNKYIVSRKMEKNKLKVADLVNKTELAKSEHELQQALTDYKNSKVLNDQITDLNSSLQNANDRISELSKMNKELNEKYHDALKEVNVLDNNNKNLVSKYEFESLSKKVITDYDTVEEAIQKNNWLKEYLRFRNTKLFNSFKAIAKLVGVSKDDIKNVISQDTIDEYKKMDIIKTVDNKAGLSNYQFTDKGTFFWGLYTPDLKY